MTDLDITGIERAIDDAFVAACPRHRSWECATAYVLWAHALRATVWTSPTGVAHEPGSPEADMENRKYGIMHGFRFLHPLASRPKPGLLAEVSPDARAWALAHLELGTDYDAVVGAFTQLRSGVLRITDVSPSRVVFAHADPRDYAFCAAQYLLHESPDSGQRAAQLCRRARAQPTSPDVVRALTVSPDRPALLAQAEQVLASAFQLPAAWHYDGVRIDTLRRFWGTLLVLSHMQFAQGAVVAAERDPGWSVLLRVSRRHLTTCVADSCGTTEETAERLLAWHTYDRHFAKADVALTPLVDMGNGFLAASPELLFSSSFERNFYAHLARVDSPAVDSVSALLSPAMTEQLAATFRSRGFRVATNVGYTCTAGQGDVDLLVWSSSEQRVLGLELKWYIAPGDYREVINRDRAAATSLDSQLRTCRVAMQEGASALVQRAFDLAHPVTVADWSVGLVMRNHCGSAWLTSRRAWFAPEAALRRALRQETTLAALERHFASYAWLPRLGEHYEPFTATVFTPGGYRLEVPAYRPTMFKNQNVV